MAGKYTEAQKRATVKWQEENTDLIRIRVPKSLTAYITSVLEEKLKEEH